MIYPDLSTGIRNDSLKRPSGNEYKKGIPT